MRTTTAPPPGTPAIAAAGEILEHVTATGLRITTVRRASTPVVELRLSIPLGASPDATTGEPPTTSDPTTSDPTTPGHAATAELLGAVLLAGTSRRTRADLDAALGLAGGTLRVSVTPERLTLTGAVAAGGLPAALGVLGEALADPDRALAEVLAERTLLAHRVRMYRAQPRTAAREALLEHCFPGHPLAREVPAADRVGAVEPAYVAALHRRRVLPAGSTLLLVGDLDPRLATDTAEAALRSWSGTGTATGLPTLPDPVPGVAVVTRPGGRQVQIRLLATVPRTDDERFPALSLAVMVLAGSLGSRLNARLRERDGVTYVVRSQLTDHPGHGLLTLEFDTAPARLPLALAGLREELDRFAGTDPPTAEEIAATRTYAAGALAIMLASQNGTANLLHRLPTTAGFATWLAGQPELIRSTGDDAVRAAARDLGPGRFGGIVMTTPDQAGPAREALAAARFPYSDRPVHSGQPGSTGGATGTDPSRPVRKPAWNRLDAPR